MKRLSIALLAAIPLFQIGGATDAFAAPFRFLKNQVQDRPTTDVVVARWPGGDIRLSEVDAYRRSDLADSLGFGGTSLTFSENVERAGLAKRLERIAQERGYLENPRFKEFERQIADRRLYEMAYRREILSVSDPSEAELEEAMRQGGRRPGRPEMAWFRYIFFDLTRRDEQEREVLRTKAQRTAELAHGGSDFGRLAWRASDLDVEEKGQIFGPTRRGQLWPEVEETLFSMEPGETSPVIETPTGLHIVQLTRRRGERRDPDEEEAEDNLRAALLLEKQAQRRETLLEALRRRYPAMLAGDLLTSPSAWRNTPPDEIVARAGPWSLTAQDLRESALERGIPPPDLGTLEEYAQELIERRLFILHAEEQERENPDAARMRAEWRHAALLLFTLDQLARERVQVSDEEVDAHYLRNLREFMRPMAATVRHYEIVSAAPEDSPEDTPPGSRDSLAAAQSFAQGLAQGLSPEDLAQTLGAMGMAAHPRPPVEVLIRDDATSPVLALFDISRVAPGRVSNPMPSKTGWLVAQIESVAPPEPWSLGRVRSLARRSLERQMMWQARAAIRRELTHDILIEAAPHEPSSPGSIENAPP